MSPGLRSICVLFLLFAAFSPQPGVCIPVGDWDISPYPLFWGAGLAAVYRGASLFEGVRTSILMGLNGSYRNVAFYRYADETPHTPPPGTVFLSSGFGAYDDVAFNWEFGIRQGILANPENGSDLLELFVIYRGLFKHNIDNGSLIIDSGLGDAGGILLNSIVPGLALSTVRSNDRHNTRHGFRAQTSLEIAPGFFLNSLYGSADFARYNLGLFFYLTLVDLGAASDNNLFSIVFSARSLFDYLFGFEIPATARQSIGGLSSISAMGGAIRGLQAGRYDAYVKLVQNVDLRFNFPGFWILIPGVHLYLDAGLHGDLKRSLAFGVDRSFFSTGAGFVLNSAFAEVGIYLDYFFNENTFSLSFFFGSQY